MGSHGWNSLAAFTIGAAFGVLACDQTIRLSDPTNDGTAIDSIQKPAALVPLDDLVVDINGYRSLSDYTVTHPQKYVDSDVVWRDSDAGCNRFDVVESATRRTTRTMDGKLAKMVLTWTNATFVTFSTFYESYHYDGNGKLRVVVIDQVADHSYDPGYMAAIDDANAAIVQEENIMPRSTSAEQVAILNTENELRDGQAIFQDWLYFDASGNLIYEIRKKGVETARAADFPAIPQTFPTLYADDVHPANVVGTPSLLALAPAPTYAFHALVESKLDASQTMRGSLVAADPFDGEVSLKTKPACR